MVNKITLPFFKMILIGLTLMIALQSCMNGPDRETLIKKAVLKELHTHPRAKLIDLYKFFFLGAFGPGHMIKSRRSAEDYLNRELEKAVDFDSLPWQETGYTNAYYRINLRLVKQGLISKDSLTEAFVQSANSARPPTVEEWKKEWQLIIGVIEKMDLNIAGFESDKKNIEEILKNNHYVAHHSQTYLELYHPHYRIVNKKYFEKLLGKTEE